VSCLKHVIACIINFKQPFPLDQNLFNSVCLAIEKLGEMCQQNKRLCSMTLINRKDLTDIFYYCLQESPDRLEKFVASEKLMNTLIKYLGVQFYVLAEMFILRAYDPEKILKLKLKALVQLDESGSRIFQNVNIKTLEKYWDKTLLKVFEKNFTIENDESGDNKHSSKKICLKKEEVEDHVSTLNFLKDGMNKSVRILIESIMESIAGDTFELIKILFSKDFGKTEVAELRKNIQSQIGYLATMIGTYFEISPLVVSYQLKREFDFPENCGDLLPKWESNGTFLSFFIKYNCYLFNFSVGYFLLPFVDKNETPLFIEYGNESLLLTSYNEWIIFQEIFRVLEDTLEKPKNLLTNICTTVVWNVIPHIANNLLKAFNEAKQKDMKLEIIQRLYSICFKALKEYNLNHSQEAQLKEETHIIYVFLAQLSEIEVGINTRNQLFESEKAIDDSLFMRRKLPWILLLLKESGGHSVGQSSSQNNQMFTTETTRDIESSELQKIDNEIILSIIGEASTNYASVHPNLNNISLAQFPISDQKDFKNSLAKFSHSKRSDDGSPKKLEDIVYSFLIDNSYHICGLNLQSFGFNGEFNYTSKRSNMFLYPLPTYTKPSITVPKFRIQVKKKLGWHYEKKIVNNVDDQAKELLEGNKEENFDTLIQKMGLENLQKLIRKNKRRVKLLIQQQHEKFLLEKLETILKEQVNINKILCIETNAENIEFFNKQSELDKKLILLLANTDFIESLNEENQKQSKELKKALFNEEKRRKAEDSDDSSSSDSSVQEEIIKPEEDKIDEEEDDERGANSGNGLGPRPELKEESDYESEEEKGDSSKDSIKVVKEKKEKMNREEMENFLKTDSEEEDDDSDVEEVSDFSDDSKEDGKKKTNLTEILKKKSINEEEIPVVENQVQEVIDKKDNTDDDQFEDVSSSCHTEEVSEMNYEGMDDEEEIYEDSEGDEDAMEIDEDSESEGDDALNYDYLYDIYEDHDENSEVNYFKNFMGEAQKIEKSLIESKFLPRPVIETTAAGKISQLELEEWVEHVFFLFAYNKKKEALDSDEDLSDMDTYSLFYKFLILSCLDPQRENTTLPLLALYLVGYNAKVTKSLPNTGLLKIKIVNFLHQYALRSPSIFFKNFKLSEFKSYLDDAKETTPNKTFEEFSILDLLFKLYLETCKSKETDHRLDVILQRLMLFLLQVRFTCKDEDILSKIKELRQNNIEPLRHEILKEVLSITERYSNITEEAEITRYCKWLEYLAHMPQYRKEILLACEKLLTSEIMEDKKVIGQLIKESKESFEKGTEPTSAEKYYYNSFLTKLSLQTPEVLNILSYILNEVKDIEPEIKLFIQETQTFNNSLRDISTFYMEALELISQLVDKGFIESLTNLQGKLKKMMEVPVQYYINLSKMKEIGEQEMEIPPELLKISSDVESPNPMVSLARSYSSARQDNSNFQEILVHWMKKHRGFINTIFKASQTEENLSLWIVKKFPWILDFNVKEKILRDAFAEREREEEDNQEEDDEEISK